MILDHIVLRSPHREALLADLADRFALRLLEGYRTDNGAHSAGVRFRNGPFLDVFDWPRDKLSFTPLLALEGEIAKAQSVATKFGWVAQLHLRNDIPIQHRPPWSTLSFKRGQGLISSIFVIEYEDAPQAWHLDQYRGALYDRLSEPNGRSELNKVVIRAADIPNAAAQFEALSGAPISLLELCPAGEHEEGVESIHIQGPDASTAEWQPSAFDHFRPVGD